MGRRVEEKALGVAGTVEESEKIGFFFKRALKTVLEKKTIGFHGRRERKRDEGRWDLRELRLKDPIGEYEVARSGFGKWFGSTVGGLKGPVGTRVPFGERHILKVL